jgi:VIT1/CCC1 family predicted Fe2+/Mn2+ transporter
LEQDAIALYDALARIERDPARAAAFQTIAANERRHAEIWAAKLREAGIDVPPPAPPRFRIRFIIALARLFGTRAVADLVRALEGDEEAVYREQDLPEVAEIAADERRHAEIWRQLTAGEGGVRESAREAVTSANHPSADAVGTPNEIVAGERWHRASRSGALRAAIFGISDGLVSNTSLVMGVAGAAESDPRFVLLAGIAGLLAGSFSMAAGEYVSMQSQRELFERQIELERAELEAMPEEEEKELAAVYRAKGFTPQEAAQIAHRMFQDPLSALDTLVREELGLDPEELGSAWGAASSSFVSFALGAAVPVLPFLVGGGPMVAVVSLALSLAAMFLVGGGVGLLTGRGVVYSGLRQLVIGAAAATVTYAVGRLIGVSVS